MIDKVFRIGCSTVLLGFLLVFCFFVFVFFGSNSYETTDIAYYQAISGETDDPNSLAILGEQIDITCTYDLPYLSELEPYDGYRFHYTANRGGIFEEHTYILIVEYNGEGYLQKKDRLENEYTWRSDLIEGEDEGVSPEFELDGFTFRSVEGGYYPKEMLFIGISDERNEIAYIYYWDPDLDYVSPTVADFLLGCSGWKKVVN